MAAANVARPSVPAAAANQHKPRASGSWDDLLRNKGQDKMQQARARAAQNNDNHGGGDSNMPRRPYSSGVEWRPMSQFDQPPPPQPPQPQPVRARMELHHANQRSSQAFAAHVATLNGNPATSPLSREVTLGPEFDNGCPDYGIMPSEINYYSLKNNRRSQTYPLPQPQQASSPQRPGMYSRPRRLSNGGGMAAPRPGSFHSFDGTVDSQGRMRANSWGGMPVIEEAHAFETFPPAHYSTYQQHAYRSSAPVWQRRPEPIKQQAAAARARRPGPDELFNRLPVEVLRLVLEYVRAGHLDDRNSGSNSCATCWMRDCCAVALCNRRLLAVAREALYGDIQLVGKDGAQMGKRYKGLCAPRLVLLRRTLRANKSLGAVVRSLKVPALPDGAPVEATKYHDVVASVVMACPNLERLDGFYPSYRHGSESHLLHALETRRKLKELTWVVEATPPEPSPSVENGRSGKRTSQSRKRQSRWAPSTSVSADDSIPERRQKLAAAHASRFVMRHDNWKELTHLTIHCMPGAGLSSDGSTVAAILALLPGIDSLYLSHLPESSFNDESLLRLPRALKKLGITHCAGVTTSGLTTFATRSAAARSLETLTLIHQSIDSVDALVRMLARLDALATLNVVQAAAPTVGDDTFLFMPYLASRSLRKLHWDIFESGAVAATRADDVLSRSIAAGGFPRLRAVRVPNDPDGLFQALCKPKERADLPGDRYRNAGLVSQATSSKGYSKSSTNLASMEDPGARSSSDTRDSGKELRLLPAREYGSDLHAARLAAQGRLEAARRFPRFEATVVDEGGEVVSSEGLAGFIGDAGSRIQYCLVPDEGGTDSRGGLAVMDDLLGDGGEDLLRRGDISSNAGGGFGTGVAPCCVLPGQQVEKSEGVPSRGRLIKRDSGGKSSKERDKDKDKDKDKGKGVDLGTSTDVLKPELNDVVSTGNEVPKEVDREMMMENVINIAKDKGKGVSVALVPPTDVVHALDDGLWLDRESRDLLTCSVDVIEGPSTRGFELFSRSPVRKVEKVDHSVLNKHKDDMEQLDLTLSLPNVLLPIGAHETGAHETTSQIPGSPSQARSVQSLSNTFCTNSDGFTASMSFSGSQSFYHNPSCSLTKNSVDYEQSVGSRPLFGGIDQVSQGCWQGQSQSDPKQKEVPFGQRTSANGNGSLFQSQASWGVLDSQAVKGQHSRVLEGSSKMGSGLDRQLSFHKQFSGQSRRHDDVRSPSQSVGSHDIGSNYSFEKKREVRDRGSGSLYRTTGQKEQEQLLMGGVDFVETIIARIVSEPVQAMSRKFHEMTGQSIVCLKEGIREIMLNADKHGQILAFQKVLQNRSDIILDVLLKCHRVQLEILVALKTGLTHFLHLESSISSSELAQIFLNLRCKNLSCRSQLPVDECDCKVCAKKNGFCRECMCLVCSKFDNASNTCSWVGCDVCLHWCHTDCGLRESYIRNGHGTKGMTEMQFHCIACDHPSEMFGFVKEVFQNFAKEWSVETLCKELEYVKRIFSASKDMRGRRLHEIAEQMLPRLANKSNLPEVLRHIMSFLSDGDSSKLPMTTNFSGKEQIKENNGVAGPSPEAAWMKSIYSEKPPLLERPANILPTFDQNDKRTLVQEFQMSSIQKDFCFDELESIVKIKQAEAKMFQSRADDARREAEGLKLIALAKNEKIEEEYTNRIAKLRLTETDEIRKQKFEEAQALERAHLEYLNMKMRMETDIKDLLSKMEATKTSLAM